MPRIVITHRVEDMDRWLSFKGERAAQIAHFGSNVVDHVAADGSNAIAVTADLNDMAVFQAAMAAPPAELADAMQRHGVIPPLTVYVEK